MLPKINTPKGNDLMKKLTFNTLQKLTGLSKTLCVIFSVAELYDIFRVKTIERVYPKICVNL